MSVGQRLKNVPEKYTAGFRLLDKFTGQWEQIHRASERNVCKSKRALEQLDLVDRSCRDRINAVDSFITNYKAMPALEEQINRIGCDLNSLQNSFSKLEECLFMLAMQNEQIRCDEFIREYEGNFEAQAQMIKIQSELTKDRLMAEHLKRAQDFETRQQQVLEDRRGELARVFEAEKLQWLTKGPR